MRTRHLVAPLTLAAWALVALVGAQPASAHASLVASNPTELQILSAPPPAVLLVFDEAVQPELSAVTLTGPAKHRVPVGALSHGKYGTSYLLAPVAGAMATGEYQVTWRAVSTDDGHPTTGSFSFRTLAGGKARTTDASAVAVPAPHDSSGSRIVYSVARWLAFLAFACCLGGAFFVIACRPEGTSRPALRRLVATGWWALVATSAVMLASYAAYAERAPLGRVLDGSSLDATVGTRIGSVLILRLTLLVAMAPLGWGLLRRPSPLATGLVLGLGGLVASTWSAISHSDIALPLMVLDVVHLVATAVWLGGLAALGLVVLREKDARDAHDVVARFSSAALVSVVVLVATGCVQAWRQTGSMAALGDNDYGGLLLGKVSLVAVTLALAGVARFRILRSREQSGPQLGRLRRVVLAEAALGIGVLTVTSVLVTTEPARIAHTQILAARQASSVSSARAQVSSQALTRTSLSGDVPYDAGIGVLGKGTVQVGVTPTRPGPTQIHLTFLDSFGQPRSLARLAVALRPLAGNRTTEAVTFTQLGPGHYVSEGASFGAAGSWQLGIALQLPGGASAVAIAGVVVS
jgi:copper transport protein